MATVPSGHLAQRGSDLETRRLDGRSHAAQETHDRGEQEPEQDGFRQNPEIRKESARGEIGFTKDERRKPAPQGSSQEGEEQRLAADETEDETVRETQRLEHRDLPGPPARGQDRKSVV